ncbi:hypothetical protein LJC07_01165 [Christensenellaceae bacterium OttesenSCG-928-L17]|nr:hypothetical protein [Christensenellaceae bacterium OttesenSCG-928-L17]
MKKKELGGHCLADAVRAAYARGQTDYSMEPLVWVDENGAPIGKIADGDAAVFCCRRGEREIELTDAFTAADFPHFARTRLNDLDFAILTMYHEKYKDLPIAFAPAKGTHTLAETISRAGKTQLHCAESEKYAHVTYFFNGGNNAAFPHEDDVRIPSPKGVPFDTVPELSLPEVAKEVQRGIQKGYDFIVTNFANGDVIGHTANAEAKVQCAAAVSRYLAEVVAFATENDYVVAITADHGNLEILYTKDGGPHVSHTTSPVPFVLIDPRVNGAVSLRDGELCDVAPTMLHALHVEQPGEMAGSTLAPGHNFGDGRKALLIILDGWGIGAEDENNPIFIANTEGYDALLRKYSFSKLAASGGAVGLQEGKPGNSEAGHTNLGAGRVVMQDDVRLDAAMKDGSFERNPVFLDLLARAKKRGARLHLLALLTKKSSHGSVDYPLALLRMAKEAGLNDVFVHVIFDGRSTEPGSAPALLEELQQQMDEIGIGCIVDGVGRGIALDRDGNYEKIQKAYEAMVLGKGVEYR